jgi:hypothetical protein
MLEMTRAASCRVIAEMGADAPDRAINSPRNLSIPRKLWKEGGETALREVMLKQPAKFCALIAALQPQHFKHEVEHTIAGLSADEVRARLAESRAKLLEAGVDLEALPVVEALPAPESKSGEG